MKKVLSLHMQIPNRTLLKYFDIICQRERFYYIRLFFDNGIQIWYLIFII